jgi:chromosome segregation ATPase
LAEPFSRHFLFPNGVILNFEAGIFPLISAIFASRAMSSSSGADLLSAALSDADRRDREAMNLKMEIAHLRERLLMRVGGDASAAALEAENFALKTSLADAQESAARAQQALQTLDAKYAKALRNLGKMDVAWKTSAAALQAAKKETAARDASLRQRLDELEQLKKAHAEDTAKRQTLVSYQDEKIATLEASLRAKETELAAQLDQLHKFTLKVKELESELEATRQRHERSPQQSVSRDDFDALQLRHEQSMEANATLRGEANALRVERTSLQSQLSDTKASLTAAMAKFLQLKEENATLDVRVAAAHEKSEQSERDAAFFKSEVDRIQSQLTKRDEDMLQLERANQVLELKLSQQQRLAEDAVHVRDHEAKRLELKHELTWKDREFALENEVRTLKQQCETLQTDAETMQALHDELCGMLSSGDESANDLKALVAQALAANSEAAHTVQQQQKQLARLEKDVARMKALVEENATLKAEYEKTRIAMERIVGRKSRATANTQRFALGSVAASTSLTAASARGTTSSSSTATPATVSVGPTQSSSVVAAQQRRPVAEKENKPTANSATTASSSPATTLLAGTKRKLVLPPSTETGSRTPTKDAGNGSTIFSPRSKRVVHVASRYMQSGTLKR